MYYAGTEIKVTNVTLDWLEVPSILSALQFYTCIVPGEGEGEGGEGEGGGGRRGVTYEILVGMLGVRAKMRAKKIEHV